MSVFIVWRQEGEYEGCEIVKVCATRSKAGRVVSDLTRRGELWPVYTVEEREVE